MDVQNLPQNYVQKTFFTKRPKNQLGTFLERSENVRLLVGTPSVV